MITMAFGFVYKYRISFGLFLKTVYFWALKHKSRYNSKGTIQNLYVSKQKYSVPQGISY